MLIRTLLAAGFLFSTVGWAQKSTDRENLLGTWQTADGHDQESWLLESKGDMLRVVRTEGGKVTLEVNCKTDGTDCEAKDEGKKVTVAMYFNGSVLIQMESRDSHVITRKFVLDGVPGRMTIEVDPVTGPGKHYTMRLTKHLQAALR